MDDARTSRFLERAALAHAGFAALIATWYLGGASASGRMLLSAFGGAGILIAVVSVWHRWNHGERKQRTLLWFLPFLAFNALVVASTWTPNLHFVRVEGADVLVPSAHSPYLPSSATPSLTWTALALFDAIYLTCVNLVLCVESRTALARFWAFLLGNAAVLAVFGTLQKLLRAPGPFLGAVRSPNKTFFSTFIYHNHWGAFCVLVVAGGLGLAFHERSTRAYRDFWHSPRMAFALAALLCAATLPLSSSRSCTMLGAGLLTVAFIHCIRRNLQRDAAVSSRTRTAAITAAALAALAAVYGLARPIIAERLEDTRSQIDFMESKGTLGARAQLYRDTWQMASDQLAFGWGLGSYGTAFSRYNTLSSPDGLPQYYEDAHSDWLQSLAETGIAGSACRALLLVIPLLTLKRTRRLASLPAYLFFGCGLILAYAWVEFPFGNPAVTLYFGLSFFSAIRYAQLDARERRA